MNQPKQLYLRSHQICLCVTHNQSHKKRIKQVQLKKKKRQARSGYIIRFRIKIKNSKSYNKTWSDLHRVILLPKEMMARTIREPRFHEPAMAVSLSLSLSLFFFYVASTTTLRNGEVAEWWVLFLGLGFRFLVIFIQRAREALSLFYNVLSNVPAPDSTETRSLVNGKLHARTCHLWWRGPIEIRGTIVLANHIRPGVGNISAVYLLRTQRLDLPIWTLLCKRRGSFVIAGIYLRFFINWF